MGWDEPEIIILDESGEPEPSPEPDRSPRLGGRIAAVLVIGALLLFGLGVAVGRHLGGADDRAGTTAQQTAPPIATTSSAPSTSARTTPLTRATDPATHSSAIAPAPTTKQTFGLPSTVTLIDFVEPPTPGSEDWELIGWNSGGFSGDGSVVRFDPRGKLVTTPTPPVPFDQPTTFISTTDGIAVMSRADQTVGFIVPVGQPTAPLPPAIRSAQFIYVAPDGQHLWTVQPSRTFADSFDEITLDGTETGRRITFPPAVRSGYSSAASGAAAVAVFGIGGVYDLTADGARLITHGQILASGPTAFLTWECDDGGACAAQVVDRADMSRRPLPQWDPTLESGSVMSGVISPDGSVAAVFAPDSEGISLRLIHLDTGEQANIGLSPAGLMMDNGAQLLAFTPDSAYLLVASDSGVVPVDAATGAQLSPLPIPTLAAIAVLSAP